MHRRWSTRHHALTNPYSEDLRKKIVEALGRGTTKSQAARTFGVSRSSVKRYAKPAREGRPLAPKRRPGSKPKMDRTARRLLEADLEERPAATLSERRVFLEKVADVRVSDSTVGRMLKRLGRSRKKDRWERESATFEAYLERVLAPSLSPGQLVAMDNLSAHEGRRAREIVEGRGCELLYPPPYSPDPNPIEQAFSKVEVLMRKAEARTREALIAAMGPFPAKILLATDGSEDSVLAAQAAVNLSEDTGAELHVLHVGETRPLYPPPASGPPPSTPSRAEVERAAQGLLDLQVEYVTQSGGKVAQAYLRMGRPAEEILCLSGEIAAGLLVGNRGPSGRFSQIKCFVMSSL